MMEGRKRRRAHEILEQIRADQPLPVPQLLALHQMLIPGEREKYVEFIAEVCEEFGLQAQTAGLAVTYFDRYFSRVPRDSPACVGVELAAISCILISAKFLQMRVPAIGELCTIGHQERTRVELKKAELLVLCELGWDLHAVTPHVVLEQLFVIVDASPACKKRAEFLVDMSYYEYKMLDYTPVAVAASSLMLTWSQLREVDSEATHTKLLAEICGVELSALFKCKGILEGHFNSVFDFSPAGEFDLSPTGENTANRSESPDSVFARFDFDSLPAPPIQPATCVRGRPAGQSVVGASDTFFSPVGCGVGEEGNC